MQLTGNLLIGQESVFGSNGAIKAVNASTGAAIEPAFGGATLADLDRACALAWTAFDVYRETAPEARAAVELAKDWRTDRYLRRLEAMMIVADKDVSLVLTGTGDVLEPEAGIMGIGSGGNYALAAARALADSGLDAEAIVRRSLAIAAEICVYTNANVVIETLDAE